MLCCLFCVCVACSSSRSPWLRGHVVQVHLSGDSQSCLTSSQIHSVYLCFTIYTHISVFVIDICWHLFLLIYSVHMTSIESWPSCERNTSPVVLHEVFFFSFLFFFLCLKGLLGFLISRQSTFRFQFRQYSHILISIYFLTFFLHYDCFHLVLLEPDVTTFGQEDGAVENFPAEKLGTCHGSYLSITKLPLPTAYPALQSIVLWKGPWFTK